MDDDRAVMQESSCIFWKMMRAAKSSTQIRTHSEGKEKKKKKKSILASVGVDLRRAGTGQCCFMLRDVLALC